MQAGFEKIIENSEDDIAQSAVNMVTENTHLQQLPRMAAADVAEKLMYERMWGSYLMWCHCKNEEVENGASKELVEIAGSHWEFLKENIDERFEKLENEGIRTEDMGYEDY